jgi:hypothetical protein
VSVAGAKADLVEFNPAADHEQLALDGEAFQHIVRLADAGAITAVSLDLSDPDLPFETYEALGAYLGRMNRSCSWWIGDWLIFGEGAYGERYAQAVTATGLAPSTLQNRVYVCRHVPKSRRRARLPFGVHAEVASLEPSEQTKWLKKAEQGDWTREVLREHMKALRKDSPPPETAEVDDVMLADVARAILRDAQLADDPSYYLIPAEDMARLRAALGVEED